MNRCVSCERFVHAAEQACPFCQKALRPSAGKVLLNTLAAGATAVVLAACYGPPTSDKLDTIDSGVDADADGWNMSQDCDDGDAAINPDATEVCDDTVDNDCDGAIDAADEDCAEA